MNLFNLIKVHFALKKINKIFEIRRNRVKVKKKIRGASKAAARAHTVSEKSCENFTKHFPLNRAKQGKRKHLLLYYHPLFIFCFVLFNKIITIIIVVIMI